MFNLNKKMLDFILENKEEEIYKRTYKLKVVSKNKAEKYHELINNIKNLKLKNEEYINIINYLNQYLELVSQENIYINEKFYKTGFKDGTNLIIECIIKDN